ncbi:hypothetical protein GIV20_22265 [Pseudomonas tremae]|nr:hypothetical protein [Pseudomonas tremae]MCF5810767.1 hypothetical protein [Pseudomonas tremae]
MANELIRIQGNKSPKLFLISRRAVRPDGLKSRSPQPQELAHGRLKVVLEAFSPSGEPFFLYYPHRTQMPTKLRVFVDYLKEKCS